MGNNLKTVTVKDNIDPLNFSILFTMFADIKKCLFCTLSIFDLLHPGGHFLRDRHPHGGLGPGGPLRFGGRGRSAPRSQTLGVTSHPLRVGYSDRDNPLHPGGIQGLELGYRDVAFSGSSVRRNPELNPK